MLLYVHDQSGGHRSSPDLPCRTSTRSSVIAQVSGTPKRQVIGHRSSGGWALRPISGAYLNLVKIFALRLRNTVNWYYCGTCGKSSLLIRTARHSYGRTKSPSQISTPWHTAPILGPSQFPSFPRCFPSSPQTSPFLSWPVYCHPSALFLFL